MELELISSMKRNLSRHLKEETKVGFDFPQWQALTLKEMKRFQRENKEIIGNYTNKLSNVISKQLKNELKKGSKRELKKYKQLNKSSKNLNSSFFNLNDKKIVNLIKEVQGSNRTANTACFRMMNDQYRKVINKAAMFSNNGVISPKQAIDMATRDFLTAGINCIQYKNGTRVNIADYCDMAVRTANTRAQLIGEGQFRQELGKHLVKPTKHNSSCEKCAKWEGKILIDDVYSGGTKEDGKYPLLSEAIAQGFFHPRCEHGLPTYYKELEDIEFDDSGPTESTLKSYQEDLNWINNNIQKYERLVIGSLDKENIKKYEAIEENLKNKKIALQSKHNFKQLSEKEIMDLQTSSDNIYNSFTKLEREAMDAYSMGAYQDINDYLNGKYPDYLLANDIENKIDSAISKYSLKDDIITYKGTNRKYYEELKIGDNFKLKMYNSTSLNENIAKTFLEEKNNAVMLEIRVPKSTSCLYIGNNSAYEFEAELLLNRNLTYKVVDINESKIILEVIK